MSNVVRRVVAAAAAAVLATGVSVAGPTGPAGAVTDGGSFAWGDDSQGQLAFSASAVDQFTPVAMDSPLTGLRVSDVSIGGNHACAISLGTLLCWGSHEKGQVGIGGPLPGGAVTAPTVVTGLLHNKTVTAVSAGAETTCAVADGAVYCWGSDADDRLGNGPGLTSSTLPVLVQADPASPGAAAFNAGPVVDVSVGAETVCAIVATSGGGRAYCWGSNDQGQLGTAAVPVGPGNTAPRPLKVSDGVAALGSRSVTDIDVGDGYTSFACAVADGTVFCWGATQNGRLGIGSTAVSSYFVPQAVGGALAGRTATQVATGGGHACAIADAQAFCWGFNGSGQLGIGGSLNQDVPVPVSTAGALSGPVTDISAGFDHTCALTRVGLTRAACWGSGNDGRLGVGPIGGLDTRVPVSVVPGAMGVVDLRTIAAGENSTLAVRSSSPTAPTALAVTPGTSSLTLAWAAPVDDGGSPVTGYRASVLAGGAPVGDCTTPAAVTGCTVEGLAPGTGYEVRVVALNAADATGGDPATSVGTTVSVPPGGSVPTGGDPATGGTVGGTPSGGTTAGTGTPTAAAATTVTGWSTKRLRLAPGKVAKVRVTVAPGAGRTVAVQVRAAKGAPWRTKATRTTTSAGTATVRITGASTTRWWRLSLPATPQAAALVTKARTVRPR